MLTRDMCPLGRIFNIKKICICSANYSHNLLQKPSEIIYNIYCFCARQHVTFQNNETWQWHSIIETKWFNQQ